MLRDDAPGGAFDQKDAARAVSLAAAAMCEGGRVLQESPPATVGSEAAHLARTPRDTPLWKMMAATSMAITIMMVAATANADGTMLNRGDIRDDNAIGNITPTATTGC